MTVYSKIFYADRISNNSIPQIGVIRITGLACFPVKHLKINNSAHFCFSTLVNRAFFSPSIISNRSPVVFLTGKTAADVSKAGAFTVTNQCSRFAQFTARSGRTCTKASKTKRGVFLPEPSKTPEPYILQQIYTKHSKKHHFPV